MKKITTAMIPMKTVKNQKKKEELCAKFDANDDDEQYSIRRNRTEKTWRIYAKHKERSGANRDHNEKEHDSLVKRASQPYKSPLFYVVLSLLNPR